MALLVTRFKLSHLEDAMLLRWFEHLSHIVIIQLGSIL